MTDDEDTPDHPRPNYYGDYIMCPTVGRELSKIRELKEFYDKHSRFPCAVLHISEIKSLGMSQKELRILQKLEHIVKVGIEEKKEEKRHPATIAPLLEWEKEERNRWELDVDTLLEEESIDLVDVRYAPHSKAPKWKQELSRYRSKPVSLKSWRKINANEKENEGGDLH